MSQASYPIALKLFTKTLLIGSINRVRRHLPIQKPSQKQKNLTPEGRRFRSPFCLCLTRSFKAVAMGVVAAIDFLGQMWPTQPEPRSSGFHLPPTTPNPRTYFLCFMKHLYLHMRPPHETRVQLPCAPRGFGAGCWAILESKPQATSKSKHQSQAAGHVSDPAYYTCSCIA
jgi:hypothetical protein